jgi:trk system potassium uptake protein TrkH
VLPVTSERAFSALFHSVSAFCNAGFSLFGDSLMGVADQPLVMGTVSALLIVGGLGFGVLFQVWAWCRGRWPGLQGRRPRFDLHTRVVLGISLGLLVAGTLLVAAVEWNGAQAGTSWSLKLSQAFFQGATCRTAGFNSLDLTTLSPAILFFMIILMFIGGAPGGTAGGVKVTAVAIVWANLRSVGSGLARVRLGNREIEPVQVHRSLLVMTSFLVLAAVAIMVLLFSEGRDFLTTTFEVFSALGTVGLSLGMTPELTMAGRVVIALLMFAGRLGPLTLAGSLVGAAREPRVRLPRGRVLIG